jgi:hypothetical protein
MLQIVASLTDDTRRVNYDRNTFIIQATAFVPLQGLILFLFVIRKGHDMQGMLTEGKAQYD